MPRTLIIAVLVSLWVALAAAAGPRPVRTIDLDVPGAFSALRHSRPDHDAKVSKIHEAIVTLINARGEVVPLR